jgi:hypothetical protein
MTVGFEMRRDVREMMQKAWFLDKLSLPEPTRDMTAYETARRIEDHVRNLLPLFEPMEIEYGNQLLDRAFYTLDNMRAFDWSLMPDMLKGRDIFWTFKNPMQEASERILVSQGMEVMEIIKAAQEFGLKASPVKTDVVVKDMIRGTSAPATWRKTQDEEDAEAAEMAVRQKIASAAQEVATAADIAGKVGQSAQQLQAAGMMPPPQGLPAPALNKRTVAPSLPTPQPAPIDPYQTAA